MAITSLSDLAIGQSVSFTCNHPTDANIYQGTVIGLTTYAVAKSQEDLIPYYREVAKNIPTMAPIENLMFVLLSSTNNGVTTTVARALEWINESSLTIITNAQQFDIRIYNRPNTEITTVLDLLRSHGYSCKLVENI
jgi:hypothetical protein